MTPITYRRPWQRPGWLAALAAAALIVAPALAGCSNQQPARFATAASGTVTATASDGVEVVDVEAVEDRFEPAAIVVHPHAKVRLVVHNAGRDPHNLEIPELALTTGTIDAGTSKTLAFDAPAAGTTLSFDCAFHATLGMTGTIRVEG